MYSIFCSFDKYEGWKLYKQLQKNGMFAFSITTVIPSDCCVERILRMYDDFHRESFRTMPDQMYYICLLQEKADEQDPDLIMPKQVGEVINFGPIKIYQNEMLVITTDENNRLFYDNDLNISSIEFEGSIEFQPNKKYIIGLSDRKVIEYVE